MLRPLTTACLLVLLAGALASAPPHYIQLTVNKRALPKRAGKKQHLLGPTHPPLEGWVQGPTHPPERSNASGRILSLEGGAGILEDLGRPQGRIVVSADPLEGQSA